MSTTVRRSRRASWAMVTTLVAVVTGGCAEDRQSVVQPSPTVTTSPPVAMTTVPTTTPPTVRPTTLPVTTGIVLPPDLGRLVPSAPGVSTPGDIWQLAPKLWLFLPSDAAGDPNLTPPRPEDAEILIAYARKQKALNLAAIRYPRRFDDPELRAAYTPAGLAGRMQALEPFEGARFELGDGIVFRPRVASEPRSVDSALVLDCYMDSTYFADPATGEVWPGEESGHRTAAVFAALVMADGSWLVNDDGPEDLSCA